MKAPHLISNEDDRRSLRELWVTIRRDQDRTLLTLSSGGIALVTGLVTSLDDVLVVVTQLFAVSVALFILAVFLLLCIAYADAEYIRKILRAPPEDEKVLESNRVLKFLDWAASLCFVIGSVAAAVAAFIHQY